MKTEKKQPTMAEAILEKRITEEGTVDIAIAVAERDMWALIAKLNQPYSGAYALLDDVIAAGELARKAKKLREAKQIAERVVIDEKKRIADEKESTDAPR